MHTIVKHGLLAAIAMIVSAPAAAQRGPGAPPQNRATDLIVGKIHQDLDDSQLSALNLVAYATAISTLCPKIDLNDDAVTGAVSTIVAGGMAKYRTEAEQHAFKDRVLVGFGAMTALMLTDLGAKDRETRACSDAETAMQAEGPGSFLKPHVGR